MRHALVLAASLSLVFFGAFAVGSRLREHRLPLDVMAPRATEPATTATPGVREPSRPTTPLPTRTDSRVVAEEPSAPERHSEVPLVRIEDLPLAGGSANDVDSTLRDKGRSKRDARHKLRSRP
jgi:hypothetical protein